MFGLGMFRFTYGCAPSVDDVGEPQTDAVEGSAMLASVPSSLDGTYLPGFQAKYVDIGGQVTLVAAAEKELEDCASAFSAEVSGQANGLCLQDVRGSTPITGFNVVNHVLSFRSVGLCSVSFADAGQGLSLQLFNATDEVAPPVLLGIESLSYEVASKTLVVKPVDGQAESAFPFLQCHQISAPVAVNAAPLFASGFEGQAATGYSLSVVLTDLEGNAFGLKARLLPASAWR